MIHRASFETKCSYHQSTVNTCIVQVLRKWVKEVKFKKKVKQQYKCEERLTIKERDKLYSERSCFVLLSAPFHRTQLFPEDKAKYNTINREYTHTSFRYNKDGFILLPRVSMPPVVVRVIEALAKSQRVTDKLFSLALVDHLLLFGLAFQLKHQQDFTFPVK